MKAFFTAICACSVLIGAYCYFSPLPSMRARYRCFFRYGTLHDMQEKTSTNFLSEAEPAGLPDDFTTQYRDAVADGNIMAEQYAIAHVLTIVLCGLLFGTGLIGLQGARKNKSTRASRQVDASTNSRCASVCAASPATLGAEDNESFHHKHLGSRTCLRVQTRE